MTLIWITWIFFFQLNSLIDELEGKDIELLFNLKKADLKSQSSKYHYLLDNIDAQREKSVKYKNIKVKFF